MPDCSKCLWYPESSTLSESVSSYSGFDWMDKRLNLNFVALEHQRNMNAEELGDYGFLDQDLVKWYNFITISLWLWYYSLNLIVKFK